MLKFQEVYQEPEVDYSTWPVKELARFLRERGIDPVGFVEKSDLVAKVSEVRISLPSLFKLLKDHTWF